MVTSDYKVVQGISMSMLELEVYSLIQEGWVPTGGISVSRLTGAYGIMDELYAQAMVKEF